MAASHVQHKLTRGGGTLTIAATFDSPVTAGNAVAVWVRWSSDTITLSGVSDGTAYTLVNNPTTGGSQRCAMAYRTGHAGGATTVTATFSSAPGEEDIIIHESAGTTLTFDASDAAYGEDLGTGTDAWDPATAATFTAGAILNAFANDHGYGSAFSAGTGYTGRINVDEVESETQVFAAGGALAAKFTNADGFIEAFTGILGFKEGAAAAGHPTVKRFGGVQHAHRIGGAQMRPAVKIW